MKKPQTLKKLALFSDIHFGRWGNSRIHNQDCLDFIGWYADQVTKAGNYSHLVFMGDWFESRSAINIETLEYSYRGLQLLSNVGLPVFFIVGNHDLHRRTTRDVHSVRMFNELPNITVIDSPTVEDGILFCPYLFEEEYPSLIEHNDLWAFIGHFEFKGFVITGTGNTMDHGPDHRMFPGPKRIFSGHFHKRQQMDNVCYIGNTFPMDFGDAGDYDRGMATYEVQADKVTYTNWSNSPKYLKTTLTRVLEGKWSPLPKMKVKCIIDADLGYQDAQELRDAMIASYDLRDFVLEEDRTAKQDLVDGTTVKAEAELEFASIDELVIQQLSTIKEDKKVRVDPDLLIDIYQGLKAEALESE